MEEINQKLNILLCDYTQLKKEINVLKQNGFKEMEYSNKWIIPDYRSVSALYTHEKYKESNVFKVGSHKFNIRIYPKGNTGNKGKLGIYLMRKTRSDILLKYMFSFSLIPPDDSTATVISFGPYHQGK
ncbi:hypothetical protein ACTFIT_009929 [Dictyostelium discoideum]